MDLDVKNNECDTRLNIIFNHTTKFTVLFTVKYCEQIRGAWPKVIIIFLPLMAEARRRVLA